MDYYVSLNEYFEYMDRTYDGKASQRSIEEGENVSQRKTCHIMYCAITNRSGNNFLVFDKLRFVWSTC